MEDISKQQQSFKSLFNGRSWSKTNDVPSVLERLQSFLRNIPDQTSKERLLNSAIDDVGNTPLHIVAMEGNLKLAKLFVENGANIEALNGENNTPVQLAKKGDLSLVGRLFNAIGLSKQPNTAEVNKYLTAEQLKKDHGLSVDITNNENLDEDDLSPEQIGQEVQRALANLKKSNNEQDFLEHLARIDAYLNEHGAPEQAKREIFNFPMDSDGSSAIYFAAGLGYLRAVKFLHENKKVDVNVKNRFGSTPLHNSASNEYNDVSDYLLRSGADIDLANKAGVTPLHYALAEGKIGAARFLLGAGANPRKADNSGNTGLHYAAIEGDEAIIDDILNRKVDIDEKNELGNTALFTAVVNGNTRAVRALIGNNADANIRNKANKIPLDYAKTDEIRVLLEKGE